MGDFIGKLIVNFLLYYTGLLYFKIIEPIKSCDEIHEEYGSGIITNRGFMILFAIIVIIAIVLNIKYIFSK